MLFPTLPSWLTRTLAFYGRSASRPPKRRRQRHLPTPSRMEQMEPRTYMYTPVISGPITLDEGTPADFYLNPDVPSGSSWSFGLDFDDGSGTDTQPITHAFADEGDGTYGLIAHVQYDDGQVWYGDSDIYTVTVNNVAPTVDAGEDTSSYEGGTVSLAGSAQDPGIYDVLTPHWQITNSLDHVVYQSDDLNCEFVPAHLGTYTATLIVSDGDGGEDSDNLSISVSGVAPSAPSDLSASAASAHQINLSWADHSINETSFVIERSQDNLQFDFLDSVEEDVTSYHDVDLTPDTRYYYRVLARNVTGDSAYTSVADTTTSQVAPAAPSSLHITSSDASEVNLAWADNTEGRYGFYLERRTGNGSPWLQVATISAGQSSYTDSDLPIGTLWYYRLRAYNTAGTSGYSNSLGLARTSGTMISGNAVTDEGAVYALHLDFPQAPQLPPNTTYTVYINWGDPSDPGVHPVTCTTTPVSVYHTYPDGPANHFITVSSDPVFGVEIDPTFGRNGQVTTDVSLDDHGTDVAVQSDGKIVVCGWTGDVAGGDSHDFIVMRYDTNGLLDASFGTNGKVRTNLGANDIAASLTIQPDGKILVVGARQTDTGVSEFALVRYNTDGSLDTNSDITPGDGGFGTNGHFFTSLGGNNFAKDIVVQPDGKILAAGMIGTDFGIIRCTARGLLDSTFGGDGVVTTDISQAGYADEAKSVALLYPDDLSNRRIIVAGRSRKSSQFTETDDVFALACYRFDGSLDTGFDTDGIVTTDIGGNGQGEIIKRVLIQDNKIIAGGWAHIGSSTGSDLALARYNLDGTLDTSFDGDGLQISDFAGGDDTIMGLAVLPGAQDYQILVAGAVREQQNNEWVARFGLARYSSSGAMDQNFGTGGWFTSDFGTDYAGGKGLVVSQEPQTHIYQYNIVAGTAGNSSDHDVAVARYTGEALLPVTVLNVIPTPIISDPGPVQGGDPVHLTSSAGDPAGSDDTSSYAWAVTKDGVPFTLPAGTQTDGASFTFTPTANGSYVVQLQADDREGFLAEAFGTGGISAADLALDDRANDMLVLADGKILVVGSAADAFGKNHDFLIARYNADGDAGQPASARRAPDGSAPASQTTDARTRNAWPSRAMARFSSPGYARNGSTTDFCLVRYSADGVLDSTFGSGGKVLTDLGGDDQGRDILVQANGILVGGQANGTQFGVRAL